MSCTYTIPTYVTKIKMSEKPRILVEGKDDRIHLKNLLSALKLSISINIDTAESIKGIDQVTAKNNRAKIDHIHNICKYNEELQLLHFLRDREYIKFRISDHIENQMKHHELDNRLCYTLGHSFENYFFDKPTLLDSYSYICSSEYKTDGFTIFEQVLDSSYKLISAITLAAISIEKATYPNGLITWDLFTINNNNVELNKTLFIERNNNDVALNFMAAFEEYNPISTNSNHYDCKQISRGHTAMIMLQRIFSACLYISGKKDNEIQARKDADSFSSVKESTLSTALSEAWSRLSVNNSQLYPANLLATLCELES